MQECHEIWKTMSTLENWRSVIRGSDRLQTEQKYYRPDIYVKTTSRKVWGSWKKLYVGYKEFKKAFNNAWKRGLRRTMRLYSYPGKIVWILKKCIPCRTRWGIVWLVKHDLWMAEYFSSAIQYIPWSFHGNGMEDLQAGIEISGEVIGN